MLFPRRTWSTRVIGKMGLPIGSPEAKILIDLLIWASKQDERTTQPVARTALPIADQILFWAIRLASNPAVVERITELLHVPQEEARQLLMAMHAAGRALAAENGLAMLVEIADQGVRR